MQKAIQRAAAFAGLGAAGIIIFPSQPVLARRHVRRAPRSARTFKKTTAPSRRAAQSPVVIPPGALYDEMKLVVDRNLMPVSGGYFAPSEKLTAATFQESLRRLRAEYLHRGVKDLPPLSPVASASKALSREEAVDMLVRALAPPTAATTWSPEELSAFLLDSPSVSAPYQKSVALAAERLYIPNPLRPGDAADRAYGAELLARAFPWGASVPHAGPFVDEIRKAIAMHLFYSPTLFQDGNPVTTATLARAIVRARMYTPSEFWSLLPEMPVDSMDPHHLTRAEAISMVAMGLIADHRLSSRLAAMGSQIEDRDAGYALASRPDWYLQGFKDINAIPPQCMGTVAVGTYKGWIPNLSSEPGQLGPNQPVSMGYAATLLSRAVVRPGDYTGIAIDMTGLKPLDRAGGMWVISAGDAPGAETKADRVYPNSYPVKAFAQAPGNLGFYGDLASAERGRAGSHPLVVHALDWAKYDWSSMHGTPGLRRGGGVPISLDTYPFNLGTPPLILISKADADQIARLDTTDLLLRTARLALVQSNWSLTAMR